MDTKVLKLTGISSTTNPKFRDTIVRKGEVVRMDADLAEILQEGFRTGADENSESIPYWTEVTDDTVKINHDFSTPADTPVKAAPDAAPVASTAAADTKAAAETVTTTATRRSGQRAR